ncbi:hypothetical protein NRIC_03880 [Enterococcus florum]|uniref:Uncharacterized protein n=1 Tax=Enterococcus florum TaxID=2480627 RepID=A0A4P5P405_9ENTE|nr:hypothetical protein [Enterococcus florum]GCF92497.1 hypothetical protein NRIC_03880 [Enterococcus florum]
MKTPSFISEREEIWASRKKAKKAFDSVLNLSAEDDKGLFVGVAMKAEESNGRYTYRLLDEGMVVYSDGSPRSYLMKGTIQAFYDSLSDDYVGYINLGHVDFAIDPIILGSWTKKDLTVVDIGEGRKGLDVSFQLDDRLSKVKDLKLMNFTMAVSAEFYASINWNAVDLLEAEYPIFDQIDILGFAIVGDPGNINSAGLKLKEESNMTKQKKSFSETFEEMMSKITKKQPEQDPETKEDLAVELPEGLTIEKMAEIADEVERLKAVEKNAEEIAEQGIKLAEELIAAKEELKEAKEKLAEYDKAIPSVFEKFTALANDLELKHEQKKKEILKNDEEATDFKKALENLKAMEAAAKKEGE